MRELEPIFTGLVAVFTTLGGGYAFWAKQRAEKEKRLQDERKASEERGDSAREGLYRNLLEELERLKKQIQDLETKVEILVAKVDHRDALIDRWQGGFYEVKRLVYSHGSPELIEKVEACAQKVLSETRTK